MATVDTLLKRSLRMIGVLDIAASPSATDSAIAIPVLNQMMARWEEDGVAVGWSAVSSVSDTVPGPDSALDAIAANLALRLAPEYGVVPNALVVGLADSGHAALQRDSIKNTITPSDASHLPNSTGGRFDINSGD